MKIKLTRKNGLYFLMFLTVMVILSSTLSSCRILNEGFSVEKIFQKKM